jgi:hypothetical protein
MRAGEARGLGAVSDGDFIIAITVISIKLAPDRKVQRNRSSNLRRAYSYYGLTATYLAPDRKVQRNRSSNLRRAYSHNGRISINLVTDQNVQRDLSAIFRGAYPYDGLAKLVPDQKVRRDHS